MYRVTKEFRFEAAHRLVHHHGKCRHLHGHSYRAMVTIASENLHSVSQMVIDFQDVSDSLGTWIKKELDHNAIFNTDDSFYSLYMDSTHREFEKQPFWCVKRDPTAEVIAELIFNKVKELLDDPDYRIESVQVYETQSCSASYSE